MIKTLPIEIPPITNPMGKYWEQPSKGEVVIDQTHALMNSEAFYKLHQYDTTTPTGIYVGKMWKRSQCGKSWFMFITPDWDKNDPDMCIINARQIIVVG